MHFRRKICKGFGCKGSNTIEPSDEDEKDLFGLANRVPFYDRINHQAELSDLNIALIQSYLKEVGSSLYEKANTGNLVEVCRDMNIISNLPEYTKPKNVGLMFFSMEPECNCHRKGCRAYDEREPIEVRVENDRIEIVSFPGPDRSVTIEGLKSYRESNLGYRKRWIPEAGI